MLLSEQKRDALKNALTIGMSVTDAYIYAGLTTEEIEHLSEDKDAFNALVQIQHQLEYKLLSRMDEISQKQVKLGKEAATVWLLEKLYPRYSNKPQNESQTININLKNDDPASMDTVTIVNPEARNVNVTEIAGDEVNGVVQQ